MKARVKAIIDSRDAQEIVRELAVRSPGYVPEWTVRQKNSGEALQWSVGHFIQNMLQRLNQASDKNLLKFLDLFGVDLIPAQASRAPVVFQLTEGAADARIPVGSRVAAPPPPDGTEQIVFETERMAGIAAAKLVKVTSFWPGRDQYIDHSAEYAAGQNFKLFSSLQDTPHAIYIAHDTLLAFAGNASIDVEFELTQPGSEHLSILWEYWDGKVWRAFKDMNPACTGQAVQKLDATVGLTQSGKHHLQTDCAETKKTVVNGIEAFWIRGQLDEPMVPDPGQIVPDVDSIRLSSVLIRSLSYELKSESYKISQNTEGKIFGCVCDENGIGIEGVKVEISCAGISPMWTDIKGEYEFSEIGCGAQITISIFQISAVSDQLPSPKDKDIEQNFTIAILGGTTVDKAYFNTNPLDLSQTFYPFGQLPQPGDAFYFSSEEVFSKPGAKVQLLVQSAHGLQEELRELGDENLKSLTVLEYWNGSRWASLACSEESGSIPSGESRHQLIKFIVPPDIAKAELYDDLRYWLRLRLASGSIGFQRSVEFSATTPTPTPTPAPLALNQDSTFRYKQIIHNPPAIAKIRLGYTWEFGPLHAEHVLAFNDFQYEDQTFNAQWPGKTFQPFRSPADITPAVYLGFDKKLPNDYISLFFNIEEKPDQVEGSPMVWEYYDGSTWRHLTVEDETANLALPGMVSFIAPADAGKTNRFEANLYWIRGRLKEDAVPDIRKILGLYLNAVWVRQQQSITGERLGSSTGQAQQVFVTRYKPVLADEQILVRELAGLRAQVEWRILANEFFNADSNALEQLEKILNKPDAPLLIEYRNLRLERDSNRRITAVWVRWQEKPYLFFSTATDRHYVVDRATGRIIFGDGELGKIPPKGADVVAQIYRTGGGSVGNVKANEINQLLSGAASVQSVFNPISAEGGADVENIDALWNRGPKSVRQRSRALTTSDFETMALQANPAVAVARALPTRDAEGRMVPGWVTVVIIPKSKNPRPWPSAGLRRHVQKYLVEHVPTDVASLQHIHVTGPDYEAVGVSLTVAPLDPSEAGIVETRIRQKIQDFLHPLRGGADGSGWEPGRDVHLSDVAAVVENVEGVDFVENLALLQEGVQQGERVRIAPDRIAVAGPIFLQMRILE